MEKCVHFIHNFWLLQYLFYSLEELTGLLRQPVFQTIAILLYLLYLLMAQLFLYTHPIARTAGEMQCLRHMLLVAWSRTKYVPASVLHHHSLPLIYNRQHMERQPAKHCEQVNGKKWTEGSPVSAHLHRLRLSAFFWNWRVFSCLFKIFSSLL